MIANVQHETWSQDIERKAWLRHGNRGKCRLVLFPDMEKKKVVDWSCSANMQGSIFAIFMSCSYGMKRFLSSVWAHYVTFSGIWCLPLKAYLKTRQINHLREWKVHLRLTRFYVQDTSKKIIVHTPDKSDGHRRRKIRIVWNFIGEWELFEDKQINERQIKNRTA